MKRKWFTVLVLVALGPVALAADAWKLPAETTKYKPGPGMELTMANCALCHSADYIGTQPRLSNAAWRATVEKMRSRYGAPISTNNVDALVQYLSAAYGPSR
jgi:mono/diheme cytochrome c family protein